MDAQRPATRRQITRLDSVGTERPWRNTIVSFGRQIIVGHPEFDQDKYYEDFVTEARRAKGSSILEQKPLTTSGRQDGSNTVFPAVEDPLDNRQTVENSGEYSASEYSSSIHSQHPGSEGDSEGDEPYHVATKKEKWFIIAIISAAGLFSGLSSNIYFPSLDAIAKDLKVTPAAVDLTITSYLVVQGISPIFWGGFSDAIGRRPIYIASFAVYIIANAVLSFTPNFAVLLMFRGLQAAGSASTVSIGNGVIQDISPPLEHGAFVSFYQAIRNFSIAIGPVLGGILAQGFGFRSVFVFLLILSTIVTLFIIVFLQETMRSIAGNGTIRLKGVYKPLIRKVRKEPSYMDDPDDTLTRKKVTFMTFVEPLKLLKEKDILFNLIFGGTIYAIWSMVTASTTALFKKHFGLTELMLGVAFLPNGIGTIIGSVIVGKLMTADYQETERSYKNLHNLEESYKISPKNIPKDFPIEHTRLRHQPWISALFAISTGGYGFSLAFPAALSMRGWIAVPLILQFVIASTSNAIFALNQTLVTDLCPGKGASASAINNLVRCTLAAIGVAVINTMVESIGPGLAFLSLGLVVVLISPLSVIVWHWGPKWRASRTTRKEKLELEKGEKGKPES